MSPSRLLVVEEHASVREMLKLMLEVHGYEVEACDHGIEPLRLMQEDAFDLVITNVHLPGPHGIGTVYELRRWFPGLPIVALTNPSEHSTAQHDLLELLHPDVVIAKPFSARRLLEAVTALCEES